MGIISFKVQKDQRGVASIIIVGFLVVLLTLISVGFTKIMDRSLLSASADQQGSAANYAAQSGINAVAAYLTNNQHDPGLYHDYTDCKSADPDKNILAGRVSPNLGANTQVTCALVDTNPTHLSFNDLTSEEAKQINVFTDVSQTVQQVLFSWQWKAGASGNQQLRPSGNSDLLTYSCWNGLDSGCSSSVPLLRTTIYRNHKTDSLHDLGNLNRANTFYLYPQSGCSNSGCTTTQAINLDNNGARVGVDCNSHLDADVPAWVADGVPLNQCNVIFNNLGGHGNQGPSMHALVTPMYADAALTIKALKRDGTLAKFSLSNHVTIDVTAKAGPATKRLVADVTLTNPTSAPSYAIRSAETLCKRLRIDSSGNVDFTDGDTSQCYQGNGGAGAQVKLCLDQLTPCTKRKHIAFLGSATIVWQYSNVAPNSCKASYDNSFTNPLPDGSGTQTFNNLKTATTYILSCKDTSGTTITSSATIVVNPNPNITGLSGFGFAPSHVWLLAQSVPNGDQISNCWFNYGRTSGYGYSLNINTSQNSRDASQQNVNGNDYTSYCGNPDNYGDDGTYYVTQRATDKRCDPWGNSSVGSDDNCTNFDLGNGDIVHYQLCLSDPDGYRVCSQNACVLMDNKYKNDDSPPYSKHWAFPCDSSSESNAFGWYCNNNDCNPWPP